MNTIVCCLAICATAHNSGALADIEAAKKAFNDAKGKVRVVNILSPTCGVCINGGQVVAKDVLAKEADARLAVINVWMPVLLTDKLEAAEQSATAFTDKRVSQYWDAKQQLGKSYTDVVKLPNNRTLAWDIYFVYGPDAVWGEKPPKPDYWMHQLGDDERSLDGAKLLKAVQDILAKMPKTETVVTCPRCGHKKTETMPTNMCVLRYECAKCKTVLKPKTGDCCVYCSYGSVKCPPVQIRG